MTVEKINWWTSWVSVVLVALVAIGGFILSYAALYQVAIDNGVSDNWTAYIWPLLIDFALVVFSTAILRANFRGEQSRWPWSLVILFTLATVIFNLVHSEKVTEVNLGGISIELRNLVAVVPPLAFVLAFETLTAMVRAEVKRLGLISALAEIEAKINAKQVELDNLEQAKLAEIETKANERQAELDNQVANLINLEREYSERIRQLKDKLETMEGTVQSYVQDIEAKKEELKRLNGGTMKVYLPANLSIEQRQDIVSQMDNDGLTIEQMAELLKVSPGTIKNDKRAVKVSPNEKG